MKLPTSIFCLLAVCCTLRLAAQPPRSAAEADSLVGTTINAADYDRLTEIMPQLRDSVSTPMQILADALTGYHFGRPARSNAAIERLAGFGEVFGAELLLGMRNIAIYNCWTRGDYAGVLRHLHAIVAAAPQTAPSLANMERWMTALEKWPATAVERPAGEVVIPAAIRKVGRGEHLTLNVQMNGRSEPFIFDTGCTHANFISTAAAERLGVRIIADSIVVSGMSDGMVRLAVADSLRIGPLRVLHPTFLVADTISSMTDDGLCEAVLGTDIIRAMGEVRIEPASRRIVLPATPSEAPIRPNLHMDGGQYHLTCLYGDERLRLHFDTGNVKTDLSPRFHERFCEHLEYFGRKTTTRGGFGGVREFEVITLPHLTLEGTGRPVTLHEVEVSCEGRMNADREQIDGTIGMDFLTGGEAVTIDLERMFVRTR